MRARRRRLAGGLLAVALVVAACTGDDGAVPLDRSAAVDGVADPDATLRLGLVRPRSIDPAAVSPASLADLVLVDLFYDTLTTLDERGHAVPGLATFAADAELTSWRFTVETGRTFADGRAIDADDVVYSIDRIRSLGAGSLAANRLDEVERLAAVDDRTVQFDLRRPSAVLPEVLASPLFPIVDRRQIEVALGGGDQTPNATSDFAARFLDGRTMLLERRRGDGVAAVEVGLYESEGAAFDALRAGEVDWAPVPVDRVGEATSEFGPGGLVPFHGLFLLGINTATPPLDDPRVRRAIARAIDRDELVQAVFGASAVPLDGLVPVGVPGRTPNLCAQRCTHDPVDATAIVDQVFGDAEPTPFLLATDDSTSQEAAARLLADQFDAVGLTVDPVPFPAGTFEQLVAAGDQDLFLLGWIGVTRTPAAYLEPLFTSTSPDQPFGLDSEPIDDLLADARTQPVPALRARAWAAAENAIIESMPAVPLVQFQNLTAVAPRIRGLRLRVDGTLDLSAVEILGPAERSSDG